MASTKIWYVESKDAHTNEVIARQVQDTIPPCNTHEGVLCQDEVKRNFWEVPYRVIDELLRSKKSLNLIFEVFYRERRHAPVKRWPFAEKKKKNLETVLKKGVVKKGSSV